MCSRQGIWPRFLALLTHPWVGTLAPRRFRAARPAQMTALHRRTSEPVNAVLARPPDLCRERPVETWQFAPDHRRFSAPVGRGPSPRSTTPPRRRRAPDHGSVAFHAQQQGWKRGMSGTTGPTSLQQRADAVGRRAAPSLCAGLGRAGASRSVEGPTDVSGEPPFSRASHVQLWPSSSSPSAPGSATGPPPPASASSPSPTFLPAQSRPPLDTR
jgi:hypothetical protein